VLVTPTRRNQKAEAFQWNLGDSSNTVSQ
jgi:hypothetical protein